jgi:1,6-anhydro-N-acetylmuramate kinase
MTTAEEGRRVGVRGGGAVARVLSARLAERWKRSVKKHVACWVSQREETPATWAEDMKTAQLT